jgi:hypothetical protein
MTTATSPRPVGSRLYCRPVFYAADVTASLAYYVSRLGFTSDWTVDDAAGCPVCAQVSRNGTEILLWRDAGLPAGARVYVSLHLAKQLDNLHAEFVSRAARIATAPATQPWGPYGMVVLDTDGNQLCFVGEAVTG